MALIGRAVEELSQSESMQRGYLWEFILPDIEGVGVSGADIGKFCQEVSFGEYFFSNLSNLRYGAFERKYAGDLGISDVKAHFLCPVPDLISFYFSAWRSLIVSDQGYYSPKSFYALNTGQIQFLRGDDSRSVGFRLWGLFPKTFPAYVLSYKGDSTLVSYDVVFSVDKIERIQ